MRVLKRTFDDRVGASLPCQDSGQAAEGPQYFTSPSGLPWMNLWSSVVDKATTRLEGAINLMMFDDQAAILCEIEAALASVK